jgi:hypothetical protein
MMSVTARSAREQIRQIANSIKGFGFTNPMARERIE